MRTHTLFLFLLALGLTSCSLDDSDENSFYVEFLPIESVEVPEHFVYGETYDILLTYIKPSACYVFRDFYYVVNGNERIVAIENTVYTNENCIEDPESATVSLELTVTGTETYIFKFYQGKDEYGVDQYHLVEVPIMEDRLNSNETKAK
jgi:hypothetical protein